MPGDALEVEPQRRAGCREGIAKEVAEPRRPQFRAQRQVGEQGGGGG